MGLLDRLRPRRVCDSCPGACDDGCVILGALVEQTRPLWGEDGARFNDCAGTSRRRPIRTLRPGSDAPGRHLDREEAS